MSNNCKPHMLSEYPIGYSRYSYETLDVIAAVEAGGYFGPAAHLLRPRDILEVWAEIGADPIFATYTVTEVDVGEAFVAIRLLDELHPRRAPTVDTKPRRKA